jgi:hypothetical protein
LHSIHWNPLKINLLRVGAPAAAILRPVALPAHASASERGAAPSAQESVPLESGKPAERELSGGQSHSYKIAVISGQYLRILVEQGGIDVAVGDRRGVANTLLNIGSVHESLGETHKALEKYNEALPILRAVGARSGEATTLNNIHPELSGMVLSLVDKDGHPQNGFLRLQDIYDLKLSAELVALSACQTGLGKEIKGEGLIGLARGFMYAGAPRIVASLWKVDDRATSELMKRFYQGLLGSEQLRPAEALRQAQLTIWKRKQWREPYYWAAFVLKGEWK